MNGQLMEMMKCSSDIFQKFLLEFYDGFRPGVDPLGRDSDIWRSQIVKEITQNRSQNSPPVVRICA